MSRIRTTPAPNAKRMVCVECGMKLIATMEQAKRHGWALWVGCALCKACVEAGVNPGPTRRPTVKMMPVGPVSTPQPSYARDGDSGMDLPCAIQSGIKCRDSRGDVVEHDLYLDDRNGQDELRLELPDRASARIPCGWAFQIPPGFEGQVRPRSSSNDRRVLILEGTIDAGYRGEIHICVVNLTGKPLVIRTGDKLAQLVIAPVARAEIEVVDKLDPTERGAGGFGSTTGR